MIAATGRWCSHEHGPWPPAGRMARWADNLAVLTRRLDQLGDWLAVVERKLERARARGAGAREVAALEAERTDVLRGIAADARDHADCRSALELLTADVGEDRYARLIRHADRVFAAVAERAPGLRLIGTEGRTT